jgi:hypothetical protein
MLTYLSAARADLAAAFRSQANFTTLHAIKRRARTISERPLDLDAIATGLSGAGPETLIAVGADLLRQETYAARRWFGFGGEVAALNARALMLLGRTRRRFAKPKLDGVAHVGSEVSENWSPCALLPFAPGDHNSKPIAGG